MSRYTWLDCLDESLNGLRLCDKADRVLDAIEDANLRMMRDWAATPLRLHWWQLWRPRELPKRPRVLNTIAHRAEVADLRAKMTAGRDQALRMRSQGFR